ncbi:MAG: ShlB/FhaC/HecB family hemolysin secretion/activation protein [Cyanobacteria bacterium P01_H01_bin.21]
MSHNLFAPRPPFLTVATLATLNLISLFSQGQAAEVIDNTRPVQPTSPSALAVSLAADTVDSTTADDTVLISQSLPSNVPQNLPPLSDQIIPRDPVFQDTDQLPAEPPAPLPSPEQLLQPSEPVPAAPSMPADEDLQVVFVEKFRVEESTVFDADDLASLAWSAASLGPDKEILRETFFRDLIQRYCSEALSDLPALSTDNSSQRSNASFQESSELTNTNDDLQSSSPTQTGKNLSFEQLLQARSAITQLYITCGYITSGAILPLQTPEEQDNIVNIQVVEGSLESIEVTGLTRLDPGYIESRLAIAGEEPLNRRQLLQGLQLLQLNPINRINPLIQRVSADLQAGTRPATSILQVEVIEADPFVTELDLNNNRAPSVGSFQRGITLTHVNLLGVGDGLNISYTNTDGSNGVEGSYTIPVNPYNGTVNLRAGYTRSEVVESPFDVLDITSDSSYYEVTFRQPIFQIPTEEFVLGLTLSHQESQTELGIKDIGPFPLSRGADDDGSTRVSAVRFTQEWLKRNPNRVLAARSQFSVGGDFLDATINDAPLPDSRFFAWRGQGQWVQQLNDAGMLLLVRTDMQLTGDSLLPLEQFGIGGQDTVRGYRQDALLTDSGIYASAEVRIPVHEVRDVQGTLYVVPFLDAGTGWNVDSSTNPDDTTLIGTGLGLLWEMGDDLKARLDWGIPLISVDSREQTWQESGIYFSIQYWPF